MRDLWAAEDDELYGRGTGLAVQIRSGRAGTPGAPPEAGPINCRLCAAVFTSLGDGPRLHFSCLAESAANLRTSWAALVQRELASKLHLKQRSVSPQWRQYATLFGSDGGSFVGSSGFCATALSSPRLQPLLLWMRTVCPACNHP